MDQSFLYQYSIDQQSWVDTHTHMKILTRIKKCIDMTIDFICVICNVYNILDEEHHKRNLFFNWMNNGHNNVNKNDNQK